MMQPWTAAEERALRVLYPCAPWAEVEEWLGRGRRAIMKRAFKLGIRREVRDIPDKVRAARAARLSEHPLRLGRFLRPVVERGGVAGKVCAGPCGEWLPLGRFARHAECAGGRRAICTTCEGRVAYARNPERCITNTRKWQGAHPAQYREIKAAGERRRHGRMASGRLTVAELREIKRRHDGRCAYCGAPADTIDHVIPVSRGGRHEAGNVVPACPACNFAKHDKTPTEWNMSKSNKAEV